MNLSSQNGKRLSVIFIALGVCGLVVAIWAFSTKKNLEGSLNKERLISERLLSEKLLLDKSIDRLKEDAEELNQNLQTVKNQLAAKNIEIEENEFSLKKLQNSNANRAQLKAEIKALKQTLSDYEKQLSIIQAETLALQNQNKDLLKVQIEAQNTIAQLQADNEKLGENLAVLTSMSSNNLLEVTKKNQKLTINSKRARKILLSFDVPAESFDKIDVIIIDPSEQEFTRSNGISFKEITLTDEATASIKSLSSVGSGIRRLQVIYTPTTKLKPGIYKADVYNGKVFIGRVQVKLR